MEISALGILIQAMHSAITLRDSQFTDNRALDSSSVLASISLSFIL